MQETHLGVLIFMQGVMQEHDGMGETGTGICTGDCCTQDPEAAAHAGGAVEEAQLGNVQVQPHRGQRWVVQPCYLLPTIRGQIDEEKTRSIFTPHTTGTKNLGSKSRNHHRGSWACACKYIQFYTHVRTPACTLLYGIDADGLLK
jgi:hypothetical protein